jgi:hypothetical protein
MKTRTKSKTASTTAAVPKSAERDLTILAAIASV